MLFNSDIFVFVFLPFSLIGYYVFVQLGNFRSSVIWLALASLCFYAWWNPIYVILLLSSIVRSRKELLIVRKG